MLCFFVCVWGGGDLIVSVLEKLYCAHEIKSTFSLSKITDANQQLPSYITVSIETTTLPPHTSDTRPLAALCMTETHKA